MAQRILPRRTVDVADSGLDELVVRGFCFIYLISGRSPLHYV